MCFLSLLENIKSTKGNIFKKNKKNHNYESSFNTFVYIFNVMVYRKTPQINIVFSNNLISKYHREYRGWPNIEIDR